MSKNNSIINGIIIYYSHLIRKLPKPDCNIPKILESSPSIFENDEIYNICDCKKCCKYFFPSPPNSFLYWKNTPNNNQKEIILDTDNFLPKKIYC